MPSGVSLTGMAYMTNPYRQGGSKTWQFDATFFLSRKTEEADGKEITEATSARLRYFNANDLAFGPVGLYVVHAWVGQTDPGYSLGDADTSEYDFVGDIQWLMPLHENIIVEDGDGDTDIASSDNGEPKAKESQGMMPRMPKVDTEYRAYINFCGLPFNNNKKAGKFDIDCEQYTQIAKGGPTTVFPMSCWIVDSPRWKTDAKPVPFGNRFISASGFLVGVEDRTVSGSAHKRRFIIDVDNVIYLGAPPTTAPATPVSSSSAGQRKRPQQDFDGTPDWVKRHKNKSSGPSFSRA
ncbi:hypothetical protein DFH08DRAFT_869795 [Mycena albidolilacea]|uniref:Uncharacterized protein n=1 Tax=Mycena albidolilacea TaxID=1033008 RepID=A0AAD7A0D9_9AGAR|nr:hypothetical protein DFH08DRAFT_869795 [Mycena albidolilacea]